LSLRTFCPHGRFVPTDVLSTDVLSPDVLSPDVFSPDVLSGHLEIDLTRSSLCPDMYLQHICFTLKGRLRRYFAHPVFAHQKNLSDPLTDTTKSSRILTESTPRFYFEGNSRYEKDRAESSLNSNNWGEIAAIVGKRNHREEISRQCIFKELIFNTAGIF
jgi:hypothetical protein